MHSLAKGRSIFERCLDDYNSIVISEIPLQVNQKRDLAGDKQKQGSTGRDLDSIRAAVLDEAVIVSKSNLYCL